MEFENLIFTGLESRGIQYSHGKLKFFFDRLVTADDKARTM